MRIAIVEDYDAERQPMAVMCTEYFKRSHANGITARRRSIMMAHWYWRTRRSQSNTISGIAHRNPYPHPKKRVKHLVKTFASN